MTRFSLLYLPGFRVLGVENQKLNYGYRKKSDQICISENRWDQANICFRLLQNTSGVLLLRIWVNLREEVVREPGH